MTHKIYQIDSFAGEVFRGNPACVVILECGLSDRDLLHIASENYVAETAFILPEGDTLYLRWFTPDIEMDLCGHATLASAYAVFHFMPEYIKENRVVFHTCEGEIPVFREVDDAGEEMFCIDFPVRRGEKAELPSHIRNSLSRQPAEIYLSRDYLLIYDSAADVLSMEINREEFDKINLGTGGVIVSAPGPRPEELCYAKIGECDFVSRFFTPKATILEDPVTGSAHCTLAPYWASRLGRERLHARQLSARRGELICEMSGNRVMIKGKAVCYLTGEISV